MNEDIRIKEIDQLLRLKYNRVKILLQERLILRVLNRIESEEGFKIKEELEIIRQEIEILISKKKEILYQDETKLKM